MNRCFSKSNLFLVILIFSLLGCGKDPSTPFEEPVVEYDLEKAIDQLVELYESHSGTESSANVLAASGSDWFEVSVKYVKNPIHSNAEGPARIRLNNSYPARGPLLYMETPTGSIAYYLYANGNSYPLNPLKGAFLHGGWYHIGIRNIEPYSITSEWKKTGERRYEWKRTFTEQEGKPKMTLVETFVFDFDKTNPFVSIERKLDGTLILSIEGN